MQSLTYPQPHAQLCAPSPLLPLARVSLGAITQNAPFSPQMAWQRRGRSGAGRMRVPHCRVTHRCHSLLNHTGTPRRPHVKVPNQDHAGPRWDGDSQGPHTATTQGCSVVGMGTGLPSPCSSEHSTLPHPPRSPAPPAPHTCGAAAVAALSARPRPPLPLPAPPQPRGLAPSPSPASPCGAGWWQTGDNPTQEMSHGGRLQWGWHQESISSSSSRAGLEPS